MPLELITDGGKFSPKYNYSANTSLNISFFYGTACFFEIFAKCFKSNLLMLYLKCSMNIIKTSGQFDLKEEIKLFFLLLHSILEFQSFFF